MVGVLASGRQEVLKVLATAVVRCGVCSNSVRVLVFFRRLYNVVARVRRAFGTRGAVGGGSAMVVVLAT
jgi:hypothetical protein